MRVNKSHTGNRRSHHGVAEPRLSKCACGAFHERHRACGECGQYRGKQVIDVVARTERETRRAKRKQEEAREMGMQQGSPAAGDEQEKTQEQETDEKK